MSSTYGIVETDFGIFGRPANGDVRICCRFQGAQAIANDKSCSTKAAKRAINQARPCNQTAKRVQTQTPDEAELEAEFS